MFFICLHSSTRNRISTTNNTGVSYTIKIFVNSVSMTTSLSVENVIVTNGDCLLDCKKLPQIGSFTDGTLTGQFIILKVTIVEPLLRLGLVCTHCSIMLTSWFEENVLNLVISAP